MKYAGAENDNQYPPLTHPQAQELKHLLTCPCCGHLRDDWREAVGVRSGAALEAGDYIVCPRCFDVSVVAAITEAGGVVWTGAEGAGCPRVRMRSPLWYQGRPEVVEVIAASCRDLQAYVAMSAAYHGRVRRSKVAGVN